MTNKYDGSKAQIKTFLEKKTTLHNQAKLPLAWFKHEALQFAPAITAELREIILEIYKPKCLYCGKPTTNHIIDERNDYAEIAKLKYFICESCAKGAYYDK